MKELVDEFLADPIIRTTTEYRTLIVAMMYKILEELQDIKRQINYEMVVYKPLDNFSAIPLTNQTTTESESKDGETKTSNNEASDIGKEAKKGKVKKNGKH
jgi:hypothetical protein